MSHPSYRWKRPALLAAGLLAGASLLAPGAAVAGPAATVDVVESGRQVTFRGGGLLGLSCGAQPDTGSVTIAAETTLRVVNRTGHRATLLLDGAARGEIARDGAAQVLFHRGPVRLGLKPHCVLAAEEKTVRVQVVVPPPAEEPPPANPTGPGTTTGDRPSTGGDSPAGRAPSGDGAARPDRQPAAPDARDRDEDPALAAGAGSDDLSGAGTAVAESPPQLNVAAPDSVAAEPLASSVEPVSDDGPIGLLAVIAIVCVLGVSAGAIRAILSQRAYRSSFAVN